MGLLKMGFSPHLRDHPTALARTLAAPAYTRSVKTGGAAKKQIPLSPQAFILQPSAFC
jgi:hypothetical protein